MQQQTYHESGFLPHSFMDRNLFLLVTLTILVWLFLSLLSQAISPFHLKQDLHVSLQYIQIISLTTSLCWGAELSKVRVTWTQALSETDSLKAQVAIKKQMTAGGL